MRLIYFFPTILAIVRGGLIHHTSGPSTIYAPAALYTAAIPISTTTQYHSQDGLGQYSYGYSGGNSAKSEVKTIDGLTRGAYSYIDTNGQAQTVQYTAGSNGFRVAATNLPIAPVDDNVPVQDTPEVAQAKLEHLNALHEAEVRAAAEPENENDNDENGNGEDSSGAALTSQTPADTQLSTDAATLPLSTSNVHVASPLHSYTLSLTSHPIINYANSYSHGILPVLQTTRVLLNGHNGILLGNGLNGNGHEILLNGNGVLLNGNGHAGEILLNGNGHTNGILLNGNGIILNGDGHANEILLNGNGHANEILLNGNGHTNEILLNGNGQSNGVLLNGNGKSNGIMLNGNGNTNGIILNGNGHSNEILLNGNGQSNGIILNGNGQTNGNNGWD